MKIIEKTLIMKAHYYTDDERIELLHLYKTFRKAITGVIDGNDISEVTKIINKGIEEGLYTRDKHGINPALRHLTTANTLIESFGVDRNMIIAILLYNLRKNNVISEEEIQKTFGNDITKLIKGLLQVSLLYKKGTAVESENYHKLLLTFAEDIRVIIIMIIDRLSLMRMINHHPDQQFVISIANEAKYLYAPLAHRLGLYKIKSDLLNIFIETYLAILQINLISLK